MGGMIQVKVWFAGLSKPHRQQEGLQPTKSTRDTGPIQLTPYKWYGGLIFKSSVVQQNAFLPAA